MKILGDENEPEYPTSLEEKGSLFWSKIQFERKEKKMAAFLMDGLWSYFLLDGPQQCRGQSGSCLVHMIWFKKREREKKEKKRIASGRGDSAPFPGGRRLKLTPPNSVDSGVSVLVYDNPVYDPSVSFACIGPTKANFNFVSV